MTEMLDHGDVREPLPFRKSSFSEGGGDCVEVAEVDGMVAVRDSKDPSGPVLWFTLSEWDAFLDGVLTGEFGVKYLVVRWITVLIRFIINLIS